MFPLRMIIPEMGLMGASNGAITVASKLSKG
jgi:hypothetical protein